MHWIEQDKALYLNKEKIQVLIDQQRMTFAEVEYLNLDSINIILQNFDNSKNVVNNKVIEKKKSKKLESGSLFGDDDINVEQKGKQRLVDMSLRNCENIKYSTEMVINEFYLQQ